MSPRDLSKLRAPILVQRVRRIGRDTFSFVPHRFLSDGFLTNVDRDELAVYVFLVLAGNRDGVSFYRYDAICSILRLTLDGYIEARNGLIDKDLIAFDGTRFQVLSLPNPPSSIPSRPLRSRADFQDRDPATMRASMLDAIQSDDTPDAGE